ncbi:MAG: helix-turn-helix domain-containing protein [Lachnospiraceae bacterium]
MKGLNKYSDFGQEAKIAMIKLGLTNRELAYQLGYTESTLCDVLKGRNCSERRIKEMKRALELDKKVV